MVRFLAVVAVALFQNTIHAGSLDGKSQTNSSQGASLARNRISPSQGASLPHNETVGAISENQILKGLVCRAAISHQLAAWSKKRSWAKELGAYEAAKTFRTPTETIGVWLELRTFNAGLSQLIRRDESSVDEVTFKRELRCSPELRRVRYTIDRVRMKDSFTDTTLKTLVHQHRRGIIYAWSPSMPFSIQGFEPIRAAAQKLKIPVFFVVDPHADGPSAQRILASPPNQSFELFSRGVGAHYPAITLFQNGKILGPSIPGVKTAAIYRELLEERMRNAK